MFATTIFVVATVPVFDFFFLRSIFLLELLKKIVTMVFDFCYRRLSFCSHLVFEFLLDPSYFAGTTSSFATTVFDFCYHRLCFCYSPISDFLLDRSFLLEALKEREKGGCGCHGGSCKDYKKMLQPAS